MFLCSNWPRCWLLSANGFLNSINVYVWYPSVLFVLSSSFIKCMFMSSTPSWYSCISLVSSNFSSHLTMLELLRFSIDLVFFVIYSSLCDWNVLSYSEVFLEILMTLGSSLTCMHISPPLSSSSATQPWPSHCLYVVLFHFYSLVVGSIWSYLLFTFLLVIYEPSTS